MAKWAARRAKAKALRETDKEFWTYRRIGKKMNVTTEQARQLCLGGKKKDNNGTRDSVTEI